MARKKKSKKQEKAKAAEARNPAPKASRAKPDAANAALTNKEYAKILRDLHGELVQLQEWVKHAGLKVCIIFVVALPAPTDRQKSQMYLQRYISYLPAAGEIVIFDRSWYNRAGVERVMGFCTEEQAKRFLAAAPLVEKAIVESGVILLKYWLEVSSDEQTRRLEARIKDGRKIWKLSPMDLKSYSRWFDYSRGRDDMFKATDSSWAPWFVVRSDDKKRARLNIIRHILGQVPYEALPREKVVLPKRQKQGDYKETNYPFKFIPEAH